MRTLHSFVSLKSHMTFIFVELHQDVCDGAGYPSSSEISTSGKQRTLPQHLELPVSCSDRQHPPPGTECRTHH